MQEMQSVFHDEVKVAEFKFESIFNFNMVYAILLSILDRSHKPKSQYMTTMALAFKIEICKKNQTPLSLGQTST